MIDSSFCNAIEECFTHAHHELNFSDHLPVSISVKSMVVNKMEVSPESKINWDKASEGNMLYAYVQEVSDRTRPLLDFDPQSTAELNEEIVQVSRILTQAAQKHLPRIQQRKHKWYIKEPELCLLCKASWKTWIKWKDAGWPMEGLLYTQKREKTKQSASICCSVPSQTWTEDHPKQI